MTQPRRAHELACKIGADTRDDLISAIYDLARRLECNELSAGVIGGYGSGAIYAYRVDGDMTHDKYFDELEAHLAAERARDASAHAEMEREREEQKAETAITGCVN